jgi:hypothetical protein
MQKSRWSEHWRADAGGPGEIFVQAQTVSKRSTLIMSDFDDRVLVEQKKEAVRQALADLLSVQALTEAHLFCVTELSKLGGAA